MTDNKASKVFTSADIQNIIKEEGRALIIFEGDVYDATNFKATHPGGPKLIDNYIGKDITGAFYEEEHTKIALRMLKDTKVGSLSTSMDDNATQETDLSRSRMKEIEGEEWRKKVDPNLGTVWQVYQNLNEEEYIKFVNDPKHLTKPDDVHRMFHYPFVEFFSRTPWYHVFLFWTPIASFK